MLLPILLTAAAPKTSNYTKPTEMHQLEYLQTTVDCCRLKDKFNSMPVIIRTIENVERKSSVLLTVGTYKADK